MAQPKDEISERLSGSPPINQSERAGSLCHIVHPYAEQVKDCDSSLTNSTVLSDCDSLPSSPSLQDACYPASIEDFWTCGLRGEWAFGRFVPMRPPSPAHEDRRFYIVYLFWTFLQVLNRDLDYQPEYRLSFEAESGKLHHRWCDVVYLENNEPAIGFEIVSECKKARKVDLVDKRNEYGRIGIPVLVLIDGEDTTEPKVIVHSNLRCGQYTKCEQFTKDSIVKGHDLLEILNRKAEDYLTPAMKRKEYMKLSKNHEERVLVLDERIEKVRKEAELERQKRIEAEARTAATMELMAAEKKRTAEALRRAAVEQKQTAEALRRAAVEQKQTAEALRRAEARTVETMELVAAEKKRTAEALRRAADLEKQVAELKRSRKNE